MKKFFILTSILLVFLVTGCSDDSSSDSGIDLTDPEIGRAHV